MVAVFWYLKNKGRKFLPSSGVESSASEGIADSEEVVVKLNGKALEEGTTDYLVVNGRRCRG